MDASFTLMIQISLFLIAALAQDPKYSHGTIQMLSECGKTVTVPFRSTVMHGELEYNASSLGFFVKSDHIPPRNFR